jgi:hypothetical protein
MSEKVAHSLGVIRRQASARKLIAFAVAWVARGHNGRPGCSIASVVRATRRGPVIAASNGYGRCAQAMGVAR